MSLRLPIPKDMREELEKDPYMKRCVLESEICDGRIEWNHAFIYAGKRINELWSILPMCHFHHKTEATYRHTLKGIILLRIAHFKAVKDFHKKYPRSDLFRPKETTSIG